MARPRKSPKVQKRLRTARATGKWPKGLVDPLWTQARTSRRGESPNDGRNRDSTRLKK